MSVARPDGGGVLLAAQLRALWAEAGPGAASVVNSVVGAQAQDLAAAFYEAMLRDENARRYLDHELVRSRLRASMAAWLRDTYSRRADDEWLEYVERQAQVGLVHARIGLPMRLLTMGVRVIKREVFARIMAQRLNRDTTAAALFFAGGLLDLASEAMNEPYLADVIVNVRHRQSLQFALAGHTLAIECERLKGSLFNWHRAVVGVLYEGGSLGELSSVRGSDFGLWSRHKAALSIGGHPEYEALHKAVDDLAELYDRDVASRATGRPSRESLRLLGDRVNAVAFVLSSIADQAMATEAGRDPLTRLLNRRFLHPILQQEISLSLRDGAPFSVLVVDVDDFKRINDRHGHQVGDRVLVLLAEAMLNNVRVSDFVFRYGGEEFLLVLSAIDAAGAAAKAEHLRGSIASIEIRTDSGESFHVSVSIGIAAHDGHPDLERVVRAADRALYEAKATGKDRVVVHTSR